MSSVICTLFEGHHHYGVAALTNSLSVQGYRGIIYAAYRGALPGWAALAQENLTSAWPGSRTLEIVAGLQIVFLPFETKNHFSNCKSDLMLQLWDGLAHDATAMFCIDPDIVITTPWPLIEEWLS
ncbi:MAG: hypothetical protein EOO61_18855, partial [Hymenobacter sp.]